VPLLLLLLLLLGPLALAHAWRPSEAFKAASTQCSVSKSRLALCMILKHCATRNLADAITEGLRSSPNKHRCNV
jgi:hypothetical protein